MEYSTKSFSDTCCRVFGRQVIFSLPLVFVVSSFLSPYWLVGEKFHYGLWQICHHTENGTLCKHLEDVRTFDYGKSILFLSMTGVTVIFCLADVLAYSNDTIPL